MPTEVICLPGFGNCNPTSTVDNDGGGSPYYVDCESSWNNSLCGRDKCWRMPYQDGDTINIFNPTISTQTGINLVGLGGSPISGTPTTTVYDNEDGTQTIQASVIGANECFKIEHSLGSGLCYGWEYEPINVCKKSMVIRGMYKNGEQDCFGVTYPFDNSIRLYGYLVEGKTSLIEKTLYAKHVKKRKITSDWILYINDMVPPVIHRVLARQILAANQIRVEFEGTAYFFETDPSFSLTSEDTGNQMFSYGVGIRLKYVCEVPGKC